MSNGLFRGKQDDNGEWVVGNYMQTIIGGEEVDLIVPICRFVDLMISHSQKMYQIDPETVGQYIGIADKNDVKIFDGDIVKLHYFFENFDRRTLGVFEDEKVIIAQIKITNLGVMFENSRESGYLCDYLEEPEEELEVIGNIYDSPELLEEAK